MKYSEFFKLLKNDGWFEVRQNGSHIIMEHLEKEGHISVPFHSSKEVRKGLLSDILKKAKIKTGKR